MLWCVYIIDFQCLVYQIIIHCAHMSNGCDAKLSEHKLTYTSNKFVYSILFVLLKVEMNVLEDIQLEWRSSPEAHAASTIKTQNQCTILLWD